MAVNKQQGKNPDSCPVTTCLQRFQAVYPSHYNQPVIAVAVSGGADSMALTHALAQSGHFSAIHALIIDHNLRAESAAEAQLTAQRLAQWPHVQAHILEWSHDNTPQSRVQEAARQARYDLLNEYCQQNDITVLYLGHHQDDQLETVLMRLAAGSGLDGLRGMLPVTVNETGLSLARPLLLGANHADLSNYCTRHGLAWVEDPSNHNAQYARVRLRQNAEILAAEGLSAARLNHTAQRIQRAVEALDWAAEQFHRQSVTATGNQFRIDLNALRDLPVELSLRVIRQIMAALTPDRAYPARLDALETVLPTLLACEGHTRTTLGGVLFSVSNTQNCLHLQPEKAMK